MSDQRLREHERQWRATRSPEAKQAFLHAWRQRHRERLYLVYRTPYEDPSCKRVVELEAPSLLAWFQRGWDAAQRWAVSEDGYLEDDWAPSEWTRKQTRGGVYGLESIFREARERDLERPATEAQLSAQLQEHLYVEGDCPGLQDGTLRVFTDDDEIDLTYFLFPASYAALCPERTAFMLHRPWRLPSEAAAEGVFSPQVRVPQVAPAGEGSGTTYVIDFAIREGSYLFHLARDRAACAIPGVRVPDLPDYLRAAEPNVGAWPPFLHALRAALGERERSLAKALDRLRVHGVKALERIVEDTTTYAEVRAALGGATSQLLGYTPTPDSAKRSRRAARKHLLQLSRLESFPWGTGGWFESAYVFDDLWASAHPDLAQSLLRWATYWDPLPRA